MRVAFIGAGLQMRRRAPVVAQSADDELIEIVGTGEAPPPQVAQFGCEWGTVWEKAVARDDVDAVVVCTPPHNHADITIAALESGKHVLCEKPLCRTLEEAEAMVAAATKADRLLKCGFNHRHHPGFIEARVRFERGDFGRPIAVRCRYGICGRPGYEKEWRADPERAAGGQFAEQGVHAIDLFRWFLGELAEVSCMTSIGYFREQTLEDNGMALFRSADGALATLHASLTQWQNLFSFELVGEDGYFAVEGLGSATATNGSLSASATSTRRSRITSSSIAAATARGRPSGASSRRQSQRARAARQRPRWPRSRARDARRLSGGADTLGRPSADVVASGARDAIVVTGRAASSGWHLVAALEARGDTVDAWTRAIDITDADAVAVALRRAAPAAVIHLAAQARRCAHGRSRS